MNLMSSSLSCFNDELSLLMSALNNFRLLLLQLLYLFFDRILRNERNKALWLLTETVTIDGLLFGSLVPPGFENEHCVGGRR